MPEESVEIAGYELRCIRSGGRGTPLLLLHGYYFTSLVWRDISLLDALEGRGIPYLAVDMPYGRRSKCKPKTSDIGKNVGLVRALVSSLLGGSEPLVVGASLGGYVALRYAASSPVKGLVLIGPVGPLTHSYSSITAPTLIIYGGNDRVVGLEDMRRLSGLIPRSKLVVYEGAGHPAYLDHQDRFKDDVLKFYESISSR